MLYSVINYRFYSASGNYNKRFLFYVELGWLYIYVVTLLLYTFFCEGGVQGNNDCVQLKGFVDPFPSSAVSCL